VTELIGLVGACATQIVGRNFFNTDRLGEVLHDVPDDFFVSPFPQTIPRLLNSLSCQSRYGDDQINEQDEQVAHPAMVSTPQKTTHSGELVIRHGQA